MKDGKSEEEADAIGVRVGNAAVDNIKEDQEIVTQQSRLREYATPTAPIRVDAEKGILHDVLVLGRTSRNRADYTQEAMQEALSRYEGVPVYVGHTRDGANPDYDRKLGTITNPRLAEDGIHGDLHFPPKHRLAEQLVWDATTNPQNLGLSHDADCTWTVKDGRKIVRKIDKVYSVDAVTRPGSGKGLFEDEEITDDAHRQFAEQSMAAMDTARSIILDRTLTPDDRRTRLLESLAEWREQLHKQSDGLPAASSPLQEETKMAIDWKEVTEESLKANMPELVAKLQGTDEHTRLTEEVTALKATVTAKDAELATLQAAQAKRLQEETIVAELAAAKFPTTDAAVYSATFKEELFAAPDATKRAALIADRMALASGRVQESAFPAPLADLGAKKTDTTHHDSGNASLFVVK